MGWDQIRRSEAMGAFRFLWFGLAASTLAATLASGLAGCGDPPQRSPTVPDRKVVQLEDPGSGRFDFGFVAPGSRHTVTFALPNHDRSDVRILRVRSECECMTVPNPPSSLATAAETLVTVVLVAPEERTRYDQRILIQTNQKNRELIALRIMADVGQPLAFDPAVVDLGTVPATEKTKATLWLRHRGTKLTVTPVFASSSDLSVVAHVPRRSISPGDRLAIPLTITPEANSPGPRRVNLSLRTDSPDQPKVNAKIRYEVGVRASRRVGRGEE